MTRTESQTLGIHEGKVYFEPHIELARGHKEKYGAYRCMGTPNKEQILNYLKVFPSVTVQNDEPFIPLTTSQLHLISSCSYWSSTAKWFGS